MVARFQALSTYRIAVRLMQSLTVINQYVTRSAIDRCLAPFTLEPTSFFSAWYPPRSFHYRAHLVPFIMEPISFLSIWNYTSSLSSWNPPCSFHNGTHRVLSSWSPPCSFHLFHLFFILEPTSFLSFWNPLRSFLIGNHLVCVILGPTSFFSCWNSPHPFHVGTWNPPTSFLSSWNRPCTMSFVSFLTR